jgi:hypothetical protein
MRKLEGFAAAGCLLLLALGCGVCALFIGGDAGPFTSAGFDVALTIKLLIAFVAACLALAAVITGLLALRARDAPKRRLTRAQLLQVYRDQSRRK